MTVRSHDKLYIGGQWVDPSSSSTIEVLSPHTGQRIATVPEALPADVDRAVAAAREAFDHGPWSTTPVEERIAGVTRLAEAYQRRVPEMGALISAENGCPISFAALGQAGAPVAQFQAFLSMAASFDWEAERASMTGGMITVRREPVGVVAAVVAWNVPQLLTIAKLAPALLTGCTVVLKPAPETPLDAYLLMEAVEEAQLPPGVVNLVVANREASEHLVRHPGVDKVAFTGSSEVGRSIASICGSQLKRVSLELGGKSAAIILDDADLTTTAQGLKFASILNSGQACTNQTRILASRSNYADVVDAVVALVDAMPVGDPSDGATEIGPMVTQRQQQRVEKYIALGQEEGARLVLGGIGRPAGLETGWYVRPSVFADVDNAMRIAREEVFGPVLTVIPYDEVDDAVRIANDSDFGLAGSVWTTDVDAGWDIARRVRTGSFGINQYTADFLAPFGGFKASGIGREYGPEGLGGYTELKTIYPPPSGGGSLFA